MSQAFLDSGDLRVLVSTSIAETVTCEHCGEEFVYLADRCGTAYNTYLFGKNQHAYAAAAENRANRRLARSMNARRDFVPCPNCGKYQQSMIEKRRASARNRAAVLLCTVIIPLEALSLIYALGNLDRIPLISWYQLPPVLVGVAFGGMAAVIFRAIRRHDYNANAASRLVRPYPFVMRKADYAKLRAQRLIEQAANNSVRLQRSMASYLTHIAAPVTAGNPNEALRKNG